MNDPVSVAEAPSDSGEARPRRRWVRRVVILGGVLVVLTGVLIGIVVWGGSGPRPVTLDEAGGRLGSATTLAPEPAVLRPPQGVYLYRGSGTDKLSTPAKEQTEGPDMPATVAHRADGCWTFRIDYHSNHWQAWDFCPRNGGLDEVGGVTYQKWDFGIFVSETKTTFTCESSVTIRADQRPGDEWTQTCTGQGGPAEDTGLSTGPYRFIGPEDLRIGGAEVRALHYLRKRTMSGGQRGTELSDVWFAAADGMPLRNERHLAVDTDTFVGAVTYNEDAFFELTSLSPG